MARRRVKGVILEIGPLKTGASKKKEMKVKVDLT